MKIFCPRVLNGNRGDIASRLGVLLTFRKEGVLDIVVSCRRKEEIFPSGYTAVPCGKLYNFLPSRAGLRVLLDCDAIIWTCGLDLQDDSSLLKLLHTFLLFLYYRILGKKIYVLNQGAGPINRKSGVFLTRLILSLTDLFITRDSRTHNLLSSTILRQNCYRDTMRFLHHHFLKCWVQTEHCIQRISPDSDLH
ncbi:MAG: hypothetical protein GX089_12755 [Fibrobacter sp.]|jgi:polysaccharide pyruvyl transferase WcaK-like protein|nr:hypothetical protein [Fibrobacter sp.]